MTTIAIKLTPPKSVGCGHILAEYSDGKKTLKRVYHMDELKALALEDLEPALAAKVASHILTAKATAEAQAKPLDLKAACESLTSMEV